ncbi:MAG TPA: hypothetical protein P5119_13245 [Candidatus Aminicenantes bacterium]|nr:hypothetical protein [Candidatus Aminicenantes bacterium]HRY66291.1 hypothetical protein [Candidatus Aminicenantes bacterium]HRZ73189.1 hypothetical protein [Candidatus Aminicenantes bacterium]
MGDRRRRLGGILGFAAVVALAAGAAAETNVRSIAVGLTCESLPRTVVWKGDDASSKISGSLLSLRADLGMPGGIVFSLSAGAVLTDFRGLEFNGLPIGLAYDASPLLGLAFGAEAIVPLHEFSGLEIGATGRLVYAFGMSKTWPLEGFAVEGSAAGRSSWLEAAAGPRLTWRRLAGFVPYLEIQARWLQASFKMSETLEDLQGEETKRVRGDFSFSAALGVEVPLSDRLSLRARAGLLPRSGGADALALVGFAYTFEGRKGP